MTDDCDCYIYFLYYFWYSKLFNVTVTATVTELHTAGLALVSGWRVPPCQLFQSGKMWRRVTFSVRPSPNRFVVDFRRQLKAWRGEERRGKQSGYVQIEIWCTYVYAHVHRSDIWKLIIQTKIIFVLGFFSSQLKKTNSRVAEGSLFTPFLIEEFI